MSDSACNAFGGLLAMEALGSLDDAEQYELTAHLATCEACRCTSTEFAATVGALDQWAAAAPPARAVVVPPHLARAVLADLGTEHEVANRGRRPLRVAVACASIAAVILAAILLVGQVAGPAGTATKTLALRGGSGTTANVVLVEKDWGTSLTITEHGLARGRTYTVSMANSRGQWWTAGSYRTTGSAPVTATMACAAKFGSIAQIRVSDPAGRTVLHGETQAYEPGS